LVKGLEETPERGGLGGGVGKFVETEKGGFGRQFQNQTTKRVLEFRKIREKKSLSKKQLKKFGGKRKSGTVHRRGVVA